nr:hypothetical protein [Salinibaculum sp. KK48]
MGHVRRGTLTEHDVGVGTGGRFRDEAPSAGVDVAETDDGIAVEGGDSIAVEDSDGIAVRLSSPR